MRDKNVYQQRSMKFEQGESVMLQREDKSLTGTWHDSDIIENGTVEIVDRLGVFVSYYKNTEKKMLQFYKNGTQKQLPCIQRWQLRKAKRI